MMHSYYLLWNYGLTEKKRKKAGACFFSKKKETRVGGVPFGIFIEFYLSSVEIFVKHLHQSGWEGFG